MSFSFLIAPRCLELCSFAISIIFTRLQRVCGIWIVPHKWWLRRIASAPITSQFLMLWRALVRSLCSNRLINQPCSFPFSFFTLLFFFSGLLELFHSLVRIISWVYVPILVRISRHVWIRIILIICRTVVITLTLVVLHIKEIKFWWSTFLFVFFNFLLGLFLIICHVIVIFHVPEIKNRGFPNWKHNHFADLQCHQRVEPCAFKLEYSKPFNTVFSKFRMNNKPLVASYQANEDGASKFKLLCDSHHFLCEHTCVTMSLSLSLHSKAEVDCNYSLIGKVSCEDDKAAYKGVMELVCTVISRSSPAGWMTGKDHDHVEW